MICATTRISQFLSEQFAQLLMLASFLSGRFLQQELINVSSLVCKLQIWDTSVTVKQVESFEEYHDLDPDHS